MFITFFVQHFQQPKRSHILRTVLNKGKCRHSHHIFVYRLKHAKRSHVLHPFLNEGKRRHAHDIFCSPPETCKTVPCFTPFPKRRQTSTCSWHILFPTWNEGKGRPFNDIFYFVHHLILANPATNVNMSKGSSHFLRIIFKTWGPAENGF